MIVKQLKENFDVTSIGSYLIIILGFFITLSVSITSIIVALICLLFLIEKKYAQRWKKISYNPLVYLIWTYLSWQLLGFLWSENLQLAQDVFGRSLKLSLIPLLMMYVKKEHFTYYLKSFVAGMLLSEILTYLIWLNFIKPFMHATQEMPSPLMYHTSYTPFVAMAASILIYFLLYVKEKSLLKTISTLIFLSTMLLNLFITGGRAGQVGFFVLFLFLILFHFKKNIKQGILIFSILSVLLLSLSYSFIPLFQKRVDKGLYEVTHFKPGLQKTSLGLRIAFNKNYMEVYKKNPWIGVGTGDYLIEYKKVNDQSLYKTNITQPHNMYLLILVQFGLIGFISLLSIFIYQIYLGTKINDSLKVLRISFPLFFMIIMFVNWYLYTHHTMYLFIYFSSIFYIIDKKKIS